MKRTQRLIVAGALVPTLMTALLSVARPSFLQRAERTLDDVLVRWAAAPPPTGRVVIVDVDERSLSALGQWPWRRDVIGTLIQRLRDLGAAVVALDIIFAEPDRYVGVDVVPDVALAHALQPGRVVLGYALTFGDEATASACAPHPLGVAIVRSDEDGEPPFFRANGAVCNLPVLNEAVSSSGFLNAAPDPDGLLRRVPLVAELDGRVYPSLALAAVKAVVEARHSALRVSNVNASVLTLDDRHVPLDGKANLLLRYRGPKRTFAYISAADVLAGRTPAEAIAGKVVFVGTTALGTREVVSTPLDTLFTGVEVQATVADNLLRQDFIRRPEHGIAFESLLVVGLGLAAIALVACLGLLRGAVATAASLAIVWGAAAWLLSTAGLLLSPLFPTIGVGSALAAMTAAVLVLERRRADRAGDEKAVSRRLMIETLLSLTEMRDPETGRHSRRIQAYTRILARELSTDPAFRNYLTPERVELLATLGPLHDIGKVGVADRVLNKPGPLTPEELVELRRHPVYGRDVIATAEQQTGVRDDATLALAKDIVYTHHERWDGSGYPEGLRGLDIPIPGRVIAVVDAYDAMRSCRPYHDAVSHEAATGEIAKGRGTHFDPAVVDAFLRVAEQLRHVAADADRG